VSVSSATDRMKGDSKEIIRCLMLLPIVSSHLADRSTSLADMISTSQTTKARLLHYFPPPPLEGVEAADSYCGTHLDSKLPLSTFWFIKPE
jgi:hypothetical protein